MFRVFFSLSNSKCFFRHLERKRIAEGTEGQIKKKKRIFYKLFSSNIFNFEYLLSIFSFLSRFLFAVLNSIFIQLALDCGNGGSGGDVPSSRTDNSS